MLLLRRIFFYLFLVIYLIACPMTILYALGYILKPGMEQGLVKTGLIYISTVPSGASVYISNKRYTRRTPAILRDLTPGNYPIRISLKNHRSWFQNVPVEKEKATALEKILLVPTELKREQLSTEPFERLIPIEKSRYFLLAAGPRPGDLFVFDWKQEKIRSLFRKEDPLGEGKVLSFYSVPGGASFLLLVHIRGGERYLWVEIGGKEFRVEDISVCFPEEPLAVVWDPHDRDHLFSIHDNYVNRVDVPGRSVLMKYLENIRGFGLFHKNLYALRGDFLLERLDYDRKPREILLNDGTLGSSIFGPEGLFQIHAVNNDIIFFRGERGELLANRLPYRFLQEGAVGYEFYPPRERSLVWRKEDVGILDFSKRARNDDAFEKGPSLHWVYQRGKRIEQAFWVYEGSHILFRDENRVFLLEIETHGKPHLYSLLEVKRKTDAVYAEATGKLYYLDPESERLNSAEILPRQEILPFTFAEKKEKKKSEIEGL